MILLQYCTVVDDDTRTVQYTAVQYCTVNPELHIQIQYHRPSDMDQYDSTVRYCTVFVYIYREFTLECSTFDLTENGTSSVYYIIIIIIFFLLYGT